MVYSLKDIFRYLFLTGLVLIFISLFLDWYHFYIILEDETIVSWNYNLFIGWYTTLSEENVINDLLRPRDLAVPMVLCFALPVLAIICAYGTLFRELEKVEEMDNAHPFVILNVILVGISGFFIFGFPTFYLYPQGLYYPSISYSEKTFDGVYYYTIGLGYLIQATGFLFIFPYTIFCFQTIKRYELEKNSPQIVVSKYVEKNQENLDLDKYIAEEELKLQFKDLNIENLE